MAQGTRPEDVPMLPNGHEKAAASAAADNADADSTSAARTRLRATCAQCLVAGAVFLLSAGCGFPIGYSAVLLPQLREPNASLPIDDAMGSWIASVHSAATPVGAFASGLLTERLGRRTALQLTALPFVAGWTLIALASSHAVMLAGRLVAGLAVGLSAAPAQVLISEVAEPRMRGALAGTPMVSYSLGILCVYALGASLPWRTVAWLGIALPIAALGALSLLPESPTWLARRGRLPAAAASLRWLRGGPAAANVAQKELDGLVERMRAEETSSASSDIDSAHAREGCLAAFTRPDVLKPFCIVTTLNLMQIFSGTYLVIFYAVDLMSETEEEAAAGADDEPGVDKFLAAVLTAVVRLIFTAIACFLLSWMGRRPLGMASGLTSGAAALALGSVLYLRSTGYPLSVPYPAAVTTCLLAYMAANTCGFFVLPLITIGELLPAKVRGLAGGYIFASFNLGLFAVTKAFPSLVGAVGAHGIFWLFGTFSLLGSLFIYLMLPETRGQSLAQIEDYFLQPNVLWITRRKHQSVINTKV